LCKRTRHAVIDVDYNCDEFYKLTGIFELRRVIDNTTMNNTMLIFCGFPEKKIWRAENGRSVSGLPLECEIARKNGDCRKIDTKNCK
jgi:hypothetical protein